MEDPANRPADGAGGDPDDDAAVAERLRHAGVLAAGVEAHLGPWVERVVALRWQQWSGRPLSPPLHEAARQAGEEAAAVVGPAVRAALEADVDAPRANPLAVLRSAVAFPGRVLAAAGVPPVVRDEQAERVLPDDHYDLAPANFGDLDESLQEPGLAWGAATAHVHRRRHRGR